MMTLPQTMTCIDPAAPGGPEVLQPVTRPVPVAGPGEVLIRVAAAGVNRPDVLQRRGMYPPPAGAPSIPGLEVAGEIVAVGPEVAADQIGQQVCALVSGGSESNWLWSADLWFSPRGHAEMGNMALDRATRNPF